MMSWTHLPILILGFSGLAAGYLATIEVELDAFQVLNEKIISEGDCCDHGGGSNRCDLVFYVSNCSRLDGETYTCMNRIERFEGPKNNDSFTFPPRLRPATAFIVDRFPRELVVNITVDDEDDGWSKQDFVGNYILRFNPEMISSLEALPGPQQHVITIPGHSRLTMYYRAYCNDADCRNRPVRRSLFDNFGPKFRDDPFAGNSRFNAERAFLPELPNRTPLKPGEQRLYNDALVSYGEPFRNGDPYNFLFHADGRREPDFGP